MTRAKAALRVPQPAVREVVSHLLLDPSLLDLTIEDPPLEEVLRELFERSREGAT